MTSVTHDVRALECLTPQECGEVREALYGLRDRWETPGPAAPFYFFGAASYIDARGRDGVSYQQRVAALRPLMIERFGWVYDRVAARLAEALGAPAVYPEALGLPGFHLYLHSPQLASFVPAVHVDLQYRYHDWSQFGLPDLANPISFTLAIAVPGSGAALNLFPLTLADCRGLSRDEVDARLKSSAPTRHDYRAGVMAVHSGLQFHQIAPLGQTEPGDERITLQGHAINSGGTWCLYW